VTEGFLGWLSRFKLIRLRRIIEYRTLYRVEDSRRRCLGMGGWVGGMGGRKDGYKGGV
jgi:hypothetical protein